MRRIAAFGGLCMLMVFAMGTQLLECKQNVGCPALPDFTNGDPESCGGSGSTKGGGGGGGGQPTPTTTPDTRAVWEDIVGEYSYDSRAVACKGAAERDYEIDPITVVARLHYHTFFPEGTESEWERAAEHLADHGWGTQKSTDQYFRAVGGCVTGGVSLADETAIFGAEQWHARGHQRLLAHDPYHPRRPGEQYGARITAMTPHFDENATGFGDSCAFIGHYVEEDYNPDPDVTYSGFDRARDELFADWTEPPNVHHRGIEIQFWANFNEQIQCNGDRTFADGFVYHIGLCEESYPC